MGPRTPFLIVRYWTLRVNDAAILLWASLVVLVFGTCRIPVVTTPPLTACLVEERFLNGQLAVLGQVTGGCKMGAWRYWYSDGSLFMVGSYDANGLCHGKWVVLHRDGQPNSEQTRMIHGKDNEMRIVYAGYDEWDWDMLPEHRISYYHLLPIGSEGWIGAGDYCHGRVLSGDVR